MYGGKNCNNKSLSRNKIWSRRWSTELHNIQYENILNIKRRPRASD